MPPRKPLGSRDSRIVECLDAIRIAVVAATAEGNFVAYC
jgi:hypothetical protein